MKSHSKERRTASLTAAAWIGLAVGGVAFAQPSYNVPGVVRITDLGSGNLVVEATLGQVRNSSSDVHRISCAQSRSETTGASGAVTRTATVICQARNTERTAVCISTSEAIADALSGASNDALIELHISGIACTDLIVYESSGLIKKA